MYYAITVLIINILAIFVAGKLTKKMPLKEDDKLFILIGLTLSSIIWPISLTIIALVGIFICAVAAANWLFDKARN